MRKILIAALLTLHALNAGAAEGGGAAPTNGFSKADFRSEIAASKLQKLLGVAQGNLYISRQDGSVEVIDKEGKTLLKLVTQIGDTELLKRPEAVAVTIDTIYVVDSKTKQVVMYDAATGKYQSRFGKKSGGVFGSDFGLDEPQGIAVRDGVVYVADAGSKQIQMFGINGVFLSTLLPVARASGSSEKESPVKLGEPSDIGVDAEGRVYVRDADDKSIKIFSPDGAYLRSLPKQGRPVAMSVAEDGIYVADEESYAITKYDFAGKQMFSFGSKGEGKSQFLNLAGLAVDKAQQVFIGDAKKSLVDAFVVEAGKSLDSLPKTAGRASVKFMESIPAEVEQIAFDCYYRLYEIGVVI